MKIINEFLCGLYLKSGVPADAQALQTVGEVEFYHDLLAAPGY